MGYEAAVEQQYLRAYEYQREPSKSTEGRSRHHVSEGAFDRIAKRAFSCPVPVPYTTVYYHTPLGRFSMVDISTVGIVSVPRKSALEASRGELSEDVSFSIGTLQVVDQSSLESHPRGGMIHTAVVYSKVPY